MKSYLKILPAIITALALQFPCFAKDVDLFIQSNTTNRSNPIIDSSIHDYPISIIGNASHNETQKKCGNSSIFIGEGDAIEIAPSSPLLNANFTIEFWLNPRNGGYDKVSYYDNSHTIEYFPYNTYDFSTSQNTWYHVAISKASGTVKYF